MAHESVPPAERPVPPSVYTRRTWAVLGLILGAMFTATVAAGWFYKVPYFALLPGSARDTEELLSVEGATAYPSDGEVLYTTVRLRGQLSFWEYLWFQQDDDAEVVPEATILGDRGRTENRQFNLQLMDNSKQVAVAVALEELGYDVVDSTGIIIVGLVPDAPAEGILEPGDVIVAVGDEPVTEAIRLVELLADRRAGEEVTLAVERHTSGEVEQVVIELAEHPNGSGSGFLGIAPSTRVDFDELPFDVRIDTGDVGGPSAGLAFTLALLDDLTPGELTGGERVAVTGTIGVDGTVGSVGGVPQKAATVRDAGIAVFIVPALLGDEILDEVRDRAGPGVQVLPVEDVGDAIEALSDIGGDIESLAAGASVTN